MSDFSYLLPNEEDTWLENPRILINDRHVDSILFTGCDSSGNKIAVLLIRKTTIMQTYMHLQMASGIKYSTSETNVQFHNDWHSNYIKLECCEPMKTWRILYNGGLKKDESEELDHVRISLLWHPISSPVYYDKNGALSFSFCKGLKPNEESVVNLQKGFEQWGTLHGTILINQQSPAEVNFTSLKKRYWSSGSKDYMMLLTFSFVDKELLTSFSLFINQCAGHTRTMKKHCIVTECDLGYRFRIPSELSFQFSGCDHWYRVDTNVESPTAVLTDLQIFNIRSRINGAEADGLLFFFKKTKRKASVLPRSFFPSASVSPDFIVPLNPNEISGIALVGGKAASLMKINYYLNKSLNNKEFKNIYVPQCFCLTVNAMDACIRHNSSLNHLLNLLKYGIYEIPKSQLHSFCSKIQNQWEHSEMEPEIILAISAVVDSNKRYAVRSSGTHEDCIDLSSAGQCSSFLNISGTEEVLNAVKRCWASAYSFKSLHYRRNHGLPLTLKLGVIIQEMVHADFSGVLFTCHPTTSDPRVISISVNHDANQGESHNFENSFIVNKQDFSIHSDATDSTSANSTIRDIAEKKYSENSRVKLFERQIQKLCEVCLQFQNFFSTIVNVEWATINEKIFILQCRPVTTVFTWSDFEVCHEHDSGFTDFDAIMFHNCGETSSDVTSPLSISFVTKVMEQAFQLSPKSPDKIYHKKLLAVTQFQIAVNICNGLLLHVHRKIPFTQRIIEMIVCGQVVVTEELYALAQLKNGISNSWTSFRKLSSMIKLVMLSKRLSNRAERMAENFHIDAEQFTSSKSLFQTIIENAEVLVQIATYHLSVSSACNMLKCFVLYFMSKGDEDNLHKHIVNLSMCLEGCCTVSADIPNLLKEIADDIYGHEKGAEYLGLQSWQKFQWIHQNCLEAYRRIKYLMDRYGFRCIKEMDLMTETWSINPTPIFDSIDMLIAAKSELGFTSNQHTNSPYFQNYGKVVKNLMHCTKKAVVNRERTKQSLSMALHQFRLAFRRLGVLLTQDAFIPHSKSVFFYTMFELKQIIDGKDRKSILYKGHRRCRLWNQLENLKFDDVVIGLPHPLKERQQVTKSSDLKGTSVTCHNATGRACVLRSIKNAKSIQPGDILVVRSIDVGWSPYFPMLTGLVTELGGLMSHGAIIARECGLPCIVGVKNVTFCIQTGDKIFISGLDGLVTKLQSKDK